MSKIELGEIIDPYDFEIRASRFIADVEKSAERYTSARIEVENRTLERITELGKQIDSLRKENNPNLLKKFIAMEHDFQIESANKNTVIISLYSRTKRPIAPFGLKLTEIAKIHHGIRIEHEERFLDFGDDPSEEDYRYASVFFYEFRNSSRKPTADKS